MLSFFSKRGLFASKIGRNLPPCFGVPFIDWCRPGVIVEPHLGFAHHEEEVLIGCVPFDFGFTALGAEPRESGDGIGIDDPIEVVFLDVCESEDEREELADVVRSLHKRSAVEDLGAGVGNDATKFHDARITAAGGIDGQGR